MGLPKWECPGVSHMKIKMGPNWDLHGIAQVGMPGCVPNENKVGPNWDQHGHAKEGMPRCDPCENKDGSQLGTTWACLSGKAMVHPK